MILQQNNMFVNIILHVKQQHHPQARDGGVATRSLCARAHVYVNGMM